MKKLLIAVLSWMCVTAGAFAFPNWIGVYGGEVRHTDAANPGTYTILLNQDYVGLHAEVGVQVNNGSWTVYQMTYAGKKDTNSKWTYTPVAAYPAGAIVKYYFHGWDDWGGNIWDNSGGANYSFTVANSAAGVSFVSPVSVGANSNAAYEAAAANSQGAYLCVVEGGTQLRAAKRTDFSASGGWTNWKTLAGGTNIYATAMSANDQVVIAVATTDTGLIICRSTDQGQTYGAPSAITIPTGGVPVLEVNAATAGGSKLLIACKAGFTMGNPSIWFLQSNDNGATWSTPSEVYGGGIGLGDVKVGANAEGIFVAFNVGTGMRSADLDVAFSTDGQNWTYQTLTTVLGGTFPGVPSLIVSPSQAMVVLAGNYSIQSWKRVNGSWQQQPSTATSGDVVQESSCVQASENSLVLISDFYTNAKYWISADGGVSWSPGQTLAGVDTSMNLAGVAVAAGKLHVLWHKSVDTTQDSLWQLGTVTAGGPMLQWVGNTYNYPANGTVTSLNDLWINAETWQIAPGQSVSLSYRVYANGIFESKPMEWWYNDANNSHWHVNLGKLPAGMIVEYFVVARQGNTTLYDNNNGQNYSVTIAAAPVQWAGNVYNWPLNGQIKSTDDFWVNIESWPAGTATSARVVYSTDGVNWFAVDLTRNGTLGNNDAWHANLGKFASRKTIQYAIEVRDGTNKSIWANNNGANYRATVN